MENPMNKWMIWGAHYFWKHPYVYIYTHTHRKSFWSNSTFQRISNFRAFEKKHLMFSCRVQAEWDLSDDWYQWNISKQMSQQHEFVYLREHQTFVLFLVPFLWSLQRQSISCHQFVSHDLFGSQPQKKTNKKILEKSHDLPRLNLHSWWPVAGDQLPGLGLALRHGIGEFLLRSSLCIEWWIWAHAPGESELEARTGSRKFNAIAAKRRQPQLVRKARKNGERGGHVWWGDGENMSFFLEGFGLYWHGWKKSGGVGGGWGMSSFFSIKESVESCAGIGFLFPGIQNMSAARG